jgi:leucyl-tRNA synthetase
MADDEKDYDFLTIEKRWQEFWEREKTFRAEDVSDKPKYYALDMFPYPSGRACTSGIRRGT